MKRADFICKLTAANWSFIREGGNHTVYGKNGYHWPVGRHTEVSDNIVKSWQKLNRKIDEEE